MKYIVFDLDETLGYFKQIYYLFSIINKVDSSVKITQETFDSILDLFPEILRPNILDVLLYLKSKKEELTTYIIIYTNNKKQDWTSLIIKYITAKLSCPNFFDRIIGNSKQETCRESNEKTLDDLFRCLDLTSGTRICYIDNEYFKGMQSKYTYYLKLDNYVNDIPNDTLVERFTENELYRCIFPNVQVIVFQRIYFHYLNAMYGKPLSSEAYEYEISCTNMLLLYIQLFYLNRQSVMYSGVVSTHSPTIRTYKNRIHRVKRSGKTKKR
jgi:hypothetical protein